MDTTCETQVATRSDLSRWLACIGDRRDLRTLRDMLGNEVAWIKIESRRSNEDGREHLDTLAHQIGGDRPWLCVDVLWLYTMYRFRLLLDGASNQPRVSAALLELREWTDLSLR